MKKMQLFILVALSILLFNEKAREFSVILDFLGEGNYEAQIYADAPGTTWQTEAEKIAISTIEVNQNVKAAYCFR